MKVTGIVLSVFILLVFSSLVVSFVNYTGFQSTLKRAEQGKMHAQYSLGQMYKDGDGVLKDDKKAVNWYRKAAEQGHEWAQYTLGGMYKKGHGVLKDDKEAVNWYKKAAKQGHEWAQYTLGGMYKKGHGVLKDAKEAAKWYRKSAGQGNEYSQNVLGGMYRKGDGVPQDDIEAVKWYKKSAEQGHQFSQKSLGDMYKKGDGVLIDYKEAVKWYKKSAEQGNPFAQSSLGDMYRKGDGVIRGDKETPMRYRKTAKQSNPPIIHDTGKEDLQDDKRDITTALEEFKYVALGDREVLINTLKTVFSLTNDISVNWNHNVLKKYIETSNFIKNENTYQTLFAKHSHLGKLKKCKNLGNAELEQSDIFAIKQACEFERGNAFIQLIFKPKDLNDELMGISIKEILTEERINCGILAYENSNYYIKDKTLDIPFISKEEFPEFSFGCIIEKSGKFQVHYIIESSKEMVGNSFDSNFHIPALERKTIETSKYNFADGAHLSITLDNSDILGPYEVKVFIDGTFSKQITFNVGQFKNDKRNGQGAYTWADGGKYTGQWKDDKRNGQGTYTYANGGKYEGQWKDGNRNGQGTLTYANGGKYEGQWKDGKQNGQGSYTWADGTQYEGQWKDGKQNGQGSYTWANGTKYEGEWKDGKPQD